MILKEEHSILHSRYRSNGDVMKCNCHKTMYTLICLTNMFFVIGDWVDCSSDWVQIRSSSSNTTHSLRINLVNNSATYEDGRLHYLLNQVVFTNRPQSCVWCITPLIGRIAHHWMTACSRVPTSDKTYQILSLRYVASSSSHRTCVPDGDRLCSPIWNGGVSRPLNLSSLQ